MCFTQVSLWIPTVLSASGSRETVMICQIPDIYTTYDLERSSKMLSQHFSFPPWVWCHRKMAAVWTCSTDIRLSCKPAAGDDDTHGRCGSFRSAARCCVGCWTAVLVSGLSRAGPALWAGAWGWWWWCAEGALGWPCAPLVEDLGSTCFLLSDGSRHQASEESCPSVWPLERSGSGSGWSDTEHYGYYEIILIRKLFYDFY